MNNSSRILLLIILFVIAMIGLQCSSGSGVAGSGSSTGNAKEITGVVVDSSGIPVSGVTVYLLSEDYNPLYATGRIAIDTTDETGYWMFSDVDSGVLFNIDAEDSLGRRSFNRGLVSQENANIDTAVLKLSGTLEFVFSSYLVNKHAGVLFIPGTRICASLDTLAFYDSVNYAITINGIAEGYYSGIEYGVKEDLTSVRSISDSLFYIAAGDTLELGTYKPLIYLLTTKNSGLISDDVYSISIGKDNDIWCGTLQGDVVEYDGAEWSSFNADTFGVYSSILSIVEDRSGNRWFGAHNTVFKFSTVQETEIYLPSSSGFIGGSVYSMAVDTENVIWFTSYPSGVVSFNGTNWEHFTYDNSGLSSNSVVALAVDNFNNTKWFATSSGISAYNNGSWEVFDEIGGEPSSLTFAQSILVDSSGVVWCGLLDGKICFYNGLDWQLLRNPDTYYFSKAIYSLAVEKNGTVWVGYEDGGLFAYAGNNNWTTYCEYLPEKTKRILAIAIDGDNNKWIATENEGILYIDHSVQ